MIWGICLRGIALARRKKQGEALVGETMNAAGLPSCFTFTRDFSLQGPAATARLCDRVHSNSQLALLLI